MTDVPDRWVRRASVLWRTAPGFLVIAYVDGEVTRAEGPAPEIWDLLADPRTADELVDELAARYGVSVEAVRADVMSFVNDLVDRGLVARVAASN
jgi:hypothetical protein